MLDAQRTEHRGADDHDRKHVREEQQQQCTTGAVPLPAVPATPTTANGGTSEIVIATPGRMSPMSRRPTANAPAMPVAATATRSTSVGDSRPVICELSLGGCSSGSTTAMSYASPTTAIASATTASATYGPPAGELLRAHTDRRGRCASG